MKLHDLAVSRDAAVQRVFLWLHTYRYELARTFLGSLIIGVSVRFTFMVNLQAATSQEQVDTIFTMFKLGVVLIGILGLLTALAFCLKRSQ